MAPPDRRQSSLRDWAGSPVAIGTRKSSAALENSAAICKLNRRQVGSGRTSFQLGEFFYFD